MIQLRAPKLLKVVILLGHGTLDEGTGKIAVDSSYVCTAESGVDAGKFNFGVSPVGGGLENVITKKNYIVNMRQAAYAVAVDRVVEAMWLRGWV